jgi:3-deoxy-D-manno-octulosonic acid kinase
MDMNQRHSSSTRDYAQLGDARILYNPTRLTAISREWFDASFWELRKAVRASFQGRGEALAVETSIGPVVLRRYRRGGWMARFVRDRYLYTGYERSRPFREFDVLQTLLERGLPVAEPLAALCERNGRSYRAALLTFEIEGSRTLADVAADLASSDWSELRDVLGEFFEAGLEHPDLNARNILRDRLGRWFLIDFDRARVHASARSPQPMLRRLLRSLAKEGVQLEPSLIGL